MFLEMLFCVWIAGTIYSNFLNEPCETGIISLRANFTAFYCSDFFFFFDSFYILKLWPQASETQCLFGPGELWISLELPS